MQFCSLKRPPFVVKDFAVEHLFANWRKKETKKDFRLSAVSQRWERPS